MTKPATDLQGRAYATVLDTKEGDLLQVDSDFTCIEPNAIVKVEKADDGLWVPCRCGRHYIEGQLDFHCQHSYVGMYHHG